MPREITWRFQNLEVAYNALIEMQQKFPSAMVISERNVTTVEASITHESRRQNTIADKATVYPNSGKNWSDADKKKFMKYAQMNGEAFHAALPELVQLFGRTPDSLKTRRHEIVVKGMYKLNGERAIQEKTIRD